MYEATGDVAMGNMYTYEDLFKSYVENSVLGRKFNKEEDYIEVYVPRGVNVFNIFPIACFLQEAGIKTKAEIPFSDFTRTFYSDKPFTFNIGREDDVKQCTAEELYKERFNAYILHWAISFSTETYGIGENEFKKLITAPSELVKYIEDEKFRDKINYILYYISNTIVENEMDALEEQIDALEAKKEEINVQIREKQGQNKMYSDYMLDLFGNELDDFVTIKKLERDARKLIKKKENI